MSTHSKIGPSKANQWVNCTRSVSFIEENEHRLPPDVASVYAAEGTEAHDVAAGVLTGEDIVAGMVPQWMNTHPDLGSYLDDCETIMGSPGDTYIEEAVPLWYRPHEHGTVDFGHVSDARITIRDLKWGQGEFVDAEENLQMMIYGKSFVENLRGLGLYSFSPETVIDLGINQPRYRGEEKLRTWQITLAELDEFCVPIENAAKLITEDDKDKLVFAPSYKACLWCRAKGICAARAAEMEKGLPVPMENALAVLPDLEVSALTDEQVARMIAAAPWIEEVLKDAYKYAFNRAAAGNPIPGTKLVMGRPGNRSWTNEEEAEKILKAAKIPADQRYTQKVISPAQAEKILKPLAKSKPRVWNRFNAALTRPEGKPVLVPESDARSAITNTLDALPDENQDQN